MTLIFIITTAIIALVIFGFIMEIHRLQNVVERLAKDNSFWIKEVEDKCNRLSLVGKNYKELLDRLLTLEIKLIDSRNTISKYQERDAKRIEKEVKNKKK